MAASLFGIDREQLSNDEIDELTRAAHQQQAEPFCVWPDREVDSGGKARIRENECSSNPYSSPREISQNASATGDALVLTACVPTDDATLDYATRVHAQNTLFVAFCHFASLGGLSLFFSQFGDFIFRIAPSAPTVFVTGIFVLSFVVFLYWSNRVATQFKAGKIAHDFRADELGSNDWVWLDVRRRTMTASTETLIQTWPLRTIRCVHSDRHLIILRITGTKRHLYLPASSETIPGSFAEFRRGLRKRLRRYWWKQFATLEFS